MNMFVDYEREKFLKMFKINKVLGCGGFGVVLSVKDLQFNKNVALKVVYKKDIKFEMLKDEYDILKDLKHDNIIKIYSLINFESFAMMSMKLT
jgi:serine/threonine protein kinase